MNTLTRTLFFSALCATLLATLSAKAALVDNALLLDFGPTTTSTSTASPWRSSQTGLSGTTYDQWNTIGSTNPGSLKFANGSAATGLSLKLGHATDATTLTFASTPSINSSSLTGTNAAGAFTSAIAKDGIFTSGASNGQTRGVGVQIGGLAAGTYSVYIVARNTNSSDTIANMRASAYVSNSAITTLSLGQSGATTDTMTNGISSNSWVEGTNYTLLSSITITSGDYLNLYTIGLGGGGTPDYRGFLNSIEIVPTSLAPIPEPSTFALLGGLGALGLALCTRRKRA